MNRGSFRQPNENRGGERIEAPSCRFYAANDLLPIRRDCLQRFADILWRAGKTACDFGGGEDRQLVFHSHRAKNGGVSGAVNGPNGIVSELQNSNAGAI